MKKTIYCLIVMLVLFGCKTASESAPNAFNISGEMRNGDSSILYLQKYENGKMLTLDSAIVKDEKFEFRGTLDVPQRFFLGQKGKDAKMSFFMDAGEMALDGHIDSLRDTRVIGSELENEYQAFEESLSIFADKQEAIITDYWAADSVGDEEAKNAARDRMDALDGEKQEQVRAYLKENGSSPVSAYLGYYYLSFEGGHEELDAIIASLDPELAASPYVKIMAERSAKLKKVAIGQPAINFALESPDGKQISLADFKGKYLLIDFWASWCGPCRAENPNVVAMYEEMKDKDFDILGVSFDTKREKWLEAIEADKLTWSHVSDLKGWSSEAGQLYAVNAIPHTVLLDKEGTIIAKDLSVEELKEKLGELLD